MKEVTQNSIGKILSSDSQAERDAIHIAVIPVEASEDLNPGQHIGYKEGKTINSDYIGVIDPFLTSVLKGQRCYIFLYPNTITSLRHVWTHPLIGDEKSTIISKEASEKWLRDFISEADCPDYDTVIAAALDADDDEYLHFVDSDAHGEIPAEFWDHLEVVTGTKIVTRPKYFSCSC